MKLEEELRHLAIAVEQVGEAIIVTRTDGVIRYVNPAFTTITGYAREEAVGKTPAILKSGHHDRAFYRELWETIRRGEQWRGKFVNRRKDGRHYHEDATISPVTDADGRIVLFVAVKRDVTERIALESQLRHAQKMEAVGQLAAGIAHDFNNILTALIGYSTILQMRMGRHDPLAPLVEQSLSVLERAATLTKDLLAYSRKRIVDLKPMCVNEIVRRMESFLGRLIGEDIELSTSLAPGELVVMADGGPMEQVLLNLATNARDAMPTGGRLTIRTESVTLGTDFINRHGYGKAGDYALISVSDTGSGIPEAVRERIFEPFFTTKDVGKGTGLGLSIAYGIVKQHDGYVHVSAAEGGGTTFDIYLPVVVPHFPEAATTESPMPRGGSETVLLAEDDAEVRGLAGILLEDAGYRVVEAVDGEDAVRKFREAGGEVRLAILDVIMPGIHGKAVFEEIRKIDPGVRALFLSGYGIESLLQRGLVDEGANFVSKPLFPHEFLGKVREVLDA